MEGRGSLAWDRQPTTGSIYLKKKTAVCQKRRAGKMAPITAPRPRLVKLSPLLISLYNTKASFGPRAPGIDLIVPFCRDTPPALHPGPSLSRFVLGSMLAVTLTLVMRSLAAFCGRTEKPVYREQIRGGRKVYVDTLVCAMVCDIDKQKTGLLSDP